MVKTAFIVGSGFDSDKILKDYEQRVVTTTYGNVLLFEKGKIIFILRHGKNKNIPPHRINHKANICALNLQGVEKIIGVCSVGSLKETVKIGTIMIPDDYVDFYPKSFFDFELKSIVPELNSELMKELKAVAKKSKITTKNSGTYVHSHGPRFETRAEVKILKKYGDVLGMTMAKEATLAQELGIKYACICSVDNYANGIGKQKISQENLIKKQKLNQPKIEKIIKEMIKNNIKKKKK